MGTKRNSRGRIKKTGKNKPGGSTSGSKTKINYNFDSRNESAKEYNQRIGVARGESQSAIDKRNKGTEKVFKDKGLDANKRNGGQSIQAANIGTESPTIPPPPVPTNPGDMLGMNNASVLQEGLTLDGGQFVKDESASDQMNAAKEANANVGNIASSILGYIKPEENQLQNAYEDTYGITSRQAGREYRRAQEEVQQYTSQLNNITSSRDASILALEDTGRGQTTGFIGGEQGRIQRQAAIQALPVQAQLAAAQGNLEIAKSHVDSLFNMKVKDIETEQAYKNTVANTWMSVANTQQSNLLNAAIADSNARAEAKKTNLAYANQWAQQAYDNGQSSLAAKFMKLDTNSATFFDDLASLQGQLSKPVSGDGAPKVVDINGVSSIWNPTTGKYEAVTLDNAPGTQESFKSQVAGQGRTAVNTMLGIAEKNPGIFGRTAALWLPDAMRSDAFRNYQAQLDALKGNIVPAALQAMRDASKTGGALGNVSDREGDRLAASLGALSMEQTPAQVVNQLKQIDASLARWQDAVNAYNAGTSRGVISVGDDGLEYEIID